MVIKKVSVNNFIEEATGKLQNSSDLEDVKGSLDTSIILIKAMRDRLFKNSRNSSIPPSQDPNREKKKTRKTKGKKRKPGGQKGHKGTTLEKVDNPDEIENIEIDRRTLPDGNYKAVGYESRQIFDVEVSVHVKEYRAEILEDEHGNQYVAEFPEDIAKAAQYGNGVKSTSVYMSNFQLIPLDRIRDYFNDQLGLPISKGSISNFNKVAESNLKEIGFEDWVKKKLLESRVNHSDETGINVNGSRYWLHGLSNNKVTLYHADPKRGTEAMNRMGVLPDYKGILCHDHWSSYYCYDCDHSLCNAHHQRELLYAFEQDGQEWARKMSDLLEKIRRDVEASKERYLPEKKIKKYEVQYRTILSEGVNECPVLKRDEGKKGREKQSKSMNLLRRLSDYEEDTLRFMKDPDVPYTNNLAEGDIRMAKIHQNISKCFRSLPGARRFCLLRSYIITARKNGMTATEALICLFKKEIPPFMRE